MRDRALWYWLILSYVAGLLLLAVYFRHALNTDAVAYIRIASYYAKGRLDLAVSGYWGPLLSWLMAWPLKLGLPQLAVARGVMAFTALVFLGGSLAVYRAFNLTEKWFILGAVLTSACGLYWSVRFITPDLLLSGLTGLAVSCSLSAEQRSGARNFVAGFLWGLAYLAKAVAFPLAILFILCSAVIARLRNSLCIRNVLLSLTGFALIAGPWVLILSHKYGHPTFSTSARISHAITGPADLERYHPFATTLHRPEPGRVTSWEEPSRMPYNYWSPLASPPYAWHQLKILTRNVLVCLLLLTSLSLAWLFPAFDMARGLSWKGFGDNPKTKYLLPLLLPLLLLLLYLPTSVNLAEQRFFYPAFPFLFASVALWTNKQLELGPRSAFPALNRVQSLATLGVLLPLLGSVVVLGNAPKLAGDCAAELVTGLKKANLIGPVAGSAAIRGGRAGLYLAFLLNQPWYGDERQPTPSALKASGARLVVAVRGSALADKLAADSNFADCTERLLPNGSTGLPCPLQVYEVKEWQEAVSH